jgi:hypothetical protein
MNRMGRRSRRYVLLAILIVAATALALLPRMRQSWLVSAHQRWSQEDRRLRDSGVTDLDAVGARISAWNSLLSAWEHHPGGPAARSCLEHLENGNPFSDEAFDAPSAANTGALGPISEELRTKLVEMSKHPDMAPSTTRGGPLVIE